MKIKTRRYQLYYSLKVLVFVAALMPLKVGLAAAEVLGRTAFSLAGKYRRMAVDNMNAVLGGEEEDNVRTAGRLFVNLVKNGVEWIKLSRMRPEDVGKMVTKCTGIEHLDKTLAAGRGAVVLGFHFGNWELTGIYLKYKGYDGALIARRIYFHKYDKFIARLRGRYDARMIYRDDSPKKMLRELMEGRILGMLADQDVESVDGVFVDFFGRKAYTPTAPVKLAMTAGTKIVPLFVVRQEDDTHHVVIEEPIDVAPGESKEEDVMRYTQAWTTLLEKYVRKYPDQWVWVHNRWKTRPEDPTKDESERAQAAVSS